MTWIGMSGFPVLDAEQAQRARDVAVRRVEALERAPGVDHRRERVGDLGELRPREARPRARMPLEPARVEGDDRERCLSRLRRSWRASATARRERSPTFRSLVDSMSSATPSNARRSACRKLKHRERATRVERGLHVAGEVPGDDPYPARVQRVDEATEPDGLDDVDSGAVVRRLHPDGLDIARSDLCCGPLGSRVHRAVVDVDPRAEAPEDGCVRLRRRGRRTRRAGTSDQHGSPEGDDERTHGENCTDDV